MNEKIFFIITAVLLLVIIGYLVYLTVKISSLSQNTGEKVKEGPEKNIISILEEIQLSSERVMKKAEEFPGISEGLENKISLCLQKVGTSFRGDLSLEQQGKDISLALLNNHGDGVVISFKDKNFIVKAIEKGQSHIKLSKEEEKAIDSALN